MTNQEIIEALKKNEKPFGLMTAEMQEKAEEIGNKGNFQVFGDFAPAGKWGRTLVVEVRFGMGDTFRLRPDYEPESEIVECRIDGGCYIIENANGTTERKSLSEAINDTRFIGFKFGGGIISTSPICYYDGVDGEGIDRIYESDLLKKYEVLHATHVLFQKGLDK